VHELALFAGAGGGILGGKLLGWRTICAVERDPYAASILIRRQNEGFLPAFPVWDDVCTFDGRPWAGRVDIVSGGFPCQDISVNGPGLGIDGPRSGLWGQMARVIGEVRPRFVFVENSPALTIRGLGRVLADLSALGFYAKWGVVGAGAAGAPHLRERIWIRASHPNRLRLASPGDEQAERAKEGAGKPVLLGRCAVWETPRPDTTYALGMGDGVADRVGRIKCAGNGQVPAVAAIAWESLK
jgi:DNA (cytosine-5)-methyltransferase 1